MELDTDSVECFHPNSWDCGVSTKESKMSKKKIKVRTKSGFPSQLVGLWCFYTGSGRVCAPAGAVSIPTRGIVVFLQKMEVLSE